MRERGFPSTASLPNWPQHLDRPVGSQRPGPLSRSLLRMAEAQVWEPAPHCFRGTLQGAGAEVEQASTLMSWCSETRSRLPEQQFRGLHHNSRPCCHSEAPSANLTTPHTHALIWQHECIHTEHAFIWQSHACTHIHM